MFLLTLALVAAPDARQLAEFPELPAPLAWLEDRDDHPLVSRRLMWLEPGAESPRVLLEPLLWSFDATDWQTVAWLGNDVVVTGPVRTTRSAPNVGLAVHLVPVDGAPHVTLPGARADRLHPAPDGRVLALSGGEGLGYAVFTDGAATFHELFPELPGYRLRTALWNAAGDALFVSVAAGREDLAAGLWRLPYDGDADVSACFGEAERVGAGPAWPVAGLAGGGWITTARLGRETYSPHEIRRAEPGPDPDDAVARDLHWNRGVALQPGDGALAYVRFEDGALVVGDRVLWNGSKPADAPAWSPDGRWLAFQSRDGSHTPCIWVVEVESGAAHRLGPGLRPAWGPLASLPRTETIGDVAVWSLTVGPDEAPAGLPAHVRVTEDALACRRAGGSARILFLTFEREGDEAAYGTYALGGHKDDFPVPHPLRGDPVTWPDRDHAQALAHVLTLAGLEADQAREVVAEQAAEWFAEGLRVFFVLPLPLEPGVSELKVDPGCRVLVVRVDV